MGGTVVGVTLKPWQWCYQGPSVVMIIFTIKEGQGAHGPQLLPDHDYEALWVMCSCNPSTQEAEMGELLQISLGYTVILKPATPSQINK